MEEVTQEQIIAALNSLSQVILTKDENEIRRRTLIVNDLATKASPEVIKSLAGPKITIEEVVSSAGSLIDAAKKVVELFRRWRGI